MRKLWMRFLIWYHTQSFRTYQREYITNPYDWDPDKINAGFMMSHHQKKLDALKRG